MLCKWLPKLIKTAKELGMTTMLVTNGSRLTDAFLESNEAYSDWIALSVDSLVNRNNVKIGRALKGKIPLDKSYYYNLVDNIHSYNYTLKVNTVGSPISKKLKSALT